MELMLAVELITKGRAIRSGHSEGIRKVDHTCEIVGGVGLARVAPT